MTDNTKMRDDAIREAARNHAMDEYFKARPQLMRTRHEECLFEAGFDRAWQAEQSVPVVGEPVGLGWYLLSEYDGDERISRMIMLGQPEPDVFKRAAAMEGEIRIVYEANPPSITDSELERLRKDAERLEWLIREKAIINFSTINVVGKEQITACRVEWPELEEWITEWHDTPRAAIDAAMQERQS